MILTGILISIVSSVLTFRLIKRPEISPTRASSFISLIGFGILYGISKIYSFDFYYFSILLFGASFVGMCSHKVVSQLEVFIGACLFGVLYIFLMPVFEGLGGALGFCAFLSLVISRTLVSKSISLYTGVVGEKWSRGA